MPNQTERSIRMAQSGSPRIAPNVRPADFSYAAKYGFRLLRH